jgi:hypothetical protein
MMIGFCAGPNNALGGEPWPAAWRGESVAVTAGGGVG